MKITAVFFALALSMVAALPTQDMSKKADLHKRGNGWSKMSTDHDPTLFENGGTTIGDPKLKTDILQYMENYDILPTMGDINDWRSSQETHTSWRNRLPKWMVGSQDPVLPHLYIPPAGPKREAELKRAFIEEATRKATRM